jgi:predicted ATP-grasp superfamily ATP-dependent carboligase
MRIFVYEFCCSANEEQCPLARSLIQEGSAILSAIAHDFAQLPCVETLCLLSTRVDVSLASNVRCQLHNGSEERAFQELACDADYSLVIAPESHNMLLERIHWVERARGRLLGSSSGAVELASDKLQLANHLRKANISAPQTWLLAPREQPEAEAFPLVLKPRRGAGAQGTYLVRSLHELQTHHGRLRSSPLAPPGRGDGGEGRCFDGASGKDEMILQPYIPGQPASVSFLIGPEGPVALLPASQHLSVDGQFQYLGGSIPLADDLGSRAIALAQGAINAIPGLSGYVGVDLVLGGPADGRQDYVIEVNPRLTTSYIGLRALARDNLGEALLRVCVDGEIPDLNWHKRAVRFWADGRVQMTSAEDYPS